MREAETISLHSGSDMENTGQSTAFDLLHAGIRRWIYEQQWTQLRDAQEQAIPIILEGGRDVVIAAATASGKTEAAFLPILSRLMDGSLPGASVLYLSPLKALINDQFGRLELLCERLGIAVCPWHGDVSSSSKKKFRAKPEGILLITPESLESLFVNNGHIAPGIFARVAYIVVDELHSFIGEERGVQLQSLLRRVEIVAGRRIPRIGLSATLGDMRLAAKFLRPGDGAGADLIASSDSGQEVKLIVRGYKSRIPQFNAATNGGKAEEEDDSSGYSEVSNDLYDTLRGYNNLVFANSRMMVELLTDFLRRKCDKNRVPNEFHAHHGSLSKELREEAEASVKDKSRPVSVVCTSTLEMGIDIGAVSSVAQVGAPPSVASMRQRLGRSGRRGEPAVLRIFIVEREIDSKSHLNDELRAELIQTIAMVRLMISRWCEPPDARGIHLSTLAHQLLSIIAQYGGSEPSKAWNILCEAGPFSSVDKRIFMDFLRAIGESGLISQSTGGLLLHGDKGENIVNHYTFYAVFSTPEEFRLVTDGRNLGTLPISHPLMEGSFIIFGGQRWEVVSVDAERKIIFLHPSIGGAPPSFWGEAARVHDRVRREMFDVYSSSDIPVFLDSVSKELLAEGREAFHRKGLSLRRVISRGKNILFFCWRGDRVIDTLIAMLTLRGVKSSSNGLSCEVLNISIPDFLDHLSSIVNSPSPDPVQIAGAVGNKIINKYDPFLNESLLCLDYAASCLDVDGAIEAARDILNSMNEARLSENAGSGKHRPE